MKVIGGDDSMDEEDYRKDSFEASLNVEEGQ